MTTLGDVLAHLDAWFPPAWAEPWDAVGLVTGRRADPVQRIALAVDIVEDTVQWAIDEGAQLLVTHHPLYLRGTSSVDGDSAKGALVYRAIRAGLAIHAMHTNADVARPGVSDAIADALGLVETTPIRPLPHDATLGVGRVGRLADPSDLATFAQWVAAVLPGIRSGVRWAGTPDRRIERVAVCGGAGDDLLAEVDADVYVTSDLRHHVAQEYLALGRAALVDVPHAAAEALWLPALAARLETALPGVECRVYGPCTEPWTAITT